MGRPLSAAWRKDDEFVQVAKKLWPEDLKALDKGSARFKENRRVAALYRLRLRHIGFTAAKETGQ